MNGQYLQISFRWSEKPKTAELISVFNTAIDWLRFADNCWIVYTTSTPAKWFERLKPYMTAKDGVLIFKIDISVRHGQSNETVWSWLQKKR